jgi:hypothetical protein
MVDSSPVIVMKSLRVADFQGTYVHLVNILVTVGC